MVTLVLETGAGVPGANSYASLEYADEYFLSHPFYSDSWSGIISSDKRTALLIAASRQLDVQFLWRGTRVSTTQGLEWPRYGAYDDYGQYISQNIVPERVVQATCEMAYYLSKGDVSQNTQASQGLDRLKIDVIELEFSGSTSQPVVGSAVISLLRGLGDFASGIRVRRVVVG